MSANILAHWRRLTAWCDAKKRFWFYTKPMKAAGPLGVSYQQLEAFYEYSWAFVLVNTLIPFGLLITWYLTSLACTWHPSRQYLPQDLCYLPGFEQVNISSWPLERFHLTNGSEQVAARYLESVMVGPTALTDHTIAIRQQRRKMEKSSYSRRSQLPENLREIEQLLQGFNPKFERFSLSLCTVMDDIDQGFWTFLHIFDKFTADVEDYPYMSWASLVFYPWNHVARLLNSELNSPYLPKYYPYHWRTAREIQYEFNRFFVRSMEALSDMDRDFLARDLPTFSGNMNPLLQTNDLLLTRHSAHIDWQRSEALKSLPAHKRLAWKLGYEQPVVDSLDRYRALHDRNGDRLRDVQAGLDTWDTYLAQLRQQILSLRHLFQRKTTIVDLLFQRPNRIRALMKELKDLRKEKHVKAAAGTVQFANVMHFNMQIGRLHDMIAGVGAGLGQGGCMAKMNRARQDYQKQIGTDNSTAIEKFLKAHEDWKKGTPLPDHW